MKIKIEDNIPLQITSFTKNREIDEIVLRRLAHFWIENDSNE